MKTCAVDEVGCSSIAGPVLACAVIVDDGAQPPPGLADSKELDREKREALFSLIKERVDDFAYGAAGPRQIERINIHYARLLAMRRAIRRLLARGHHPDRTIVDGNARVPELPICINQEAIPKADRDFWEASAASVLAKVTRDRLMGRLAHREGLNHYDWESNAGYYSPRHRLGIVLHGPTEFHRRTFAFFKYCMFSREEYLGFLAEGRAPEEYFEHENARRAGLGKKPYSYYKAWKRGEIAPWRSREE
jgi:ribonuclease HII